ncbi:hypothetical protein O3M35_010476 [Rhynocoris fuscipes]|uniref:Tumor protein p53-inducible protein 13 n=1 Tax=Rhynocoris fuscipes TaxID=488301 RepID=A0AAW1D1A7_9HEMI
MFIITYSFLFLLFSFCPSLIVGRRYYVPGIAQSRLDNNDDQEWTGRWFPDKPSDVRGQNILMPSKDDDDGASDFQYLEESPRQSMMTSMINPSCDTGKDNLTVDWPNTPANYTCSAFLRKYFLPNPDLPALIHKSFIPTAYKARHVCMNEKIEYSSELPTFGPHRAAWPRYGEYKFVPPQRWLHSLEHGAVVLLYHPCAHPFLVQQAKQIVKSCLFRHVISPYNRLPHDRPMALLTWGWSLLLPDIDEELMVKFIKDHALNGPEEISRDGQYDFELIEPAKFVTIPDDKGGICPKYVKLVNK